MQRKQVEQPASQALPARRHFAWPLWPTAGGSALSAQMRTHRSDAIVAGLGIALGLGCALFPWYIFFNQDKFGVRAMQFGAAGQEGASAIYLGNGGERVGAPMSAEDIPPMQLDLLATGTLAKPSEDGSAETAPQQPFPAEADEFLLVHVANGRAMIQDDAGLWVVQPGSELPDSSRVASIEQRGGKWVLVTTTDRVIELTE